MDHNFSEKDSIFGRVSYSDNPAFFPGPFPGIADGGSFSHGDQTATATNAALSETHLFSPTLVNEFRLGFNRIATTRLQPNATTLGIPAQFGIQGIPQVAVNGGLGHHIITGLNRLGSNNYLPSVEYSNTYQLTENLTQQFGRHSMKVGYRISAAAVFYSAAPSGPGRFHLQRLVYRSSD